jgi:hypothetical protein
MLDQGDQYPTPVYQLDDAQRPDGDLLGRPTYRVLNEWRDWMDSYDSANTEFESPDGEIVRTKLQNSYQPGYGRKYYAKLKDFERGMRRWINANPSTVMLTFSASHLNDDGGLRCPADHMREIAEGWRFARKLLHKVLSGRKWEYVRIWEPHKDGYGHLHVAIFTEGEIEAEMFESVMRSYVENVTAAGTEAHQNAPCSEHAGEGSNRWDSAVSGCDDCSVPVSVNDDVENLGSYISEYLGVFGEPATERPISEQTFYAVAWATNTRRLDFSNGAQDVIKREKFRRDTGLNPEARGGREAYERYKAREAGVTGGSSGSSGSGGGDGGDGDGWSIEAICYVHDDGSREYADPTSGGVSTTVIDGKPGMDPPAKRS